MRKRDRRCVYCRILMRELATADGLRKTVATWEHIINDAKIVTRDNVAKSPLNIKNIRNTNKSLGNFSHNYQVVQTSGRDINQSLIENNLTAKDLTIANAADIQHLVVRGTINTDNQSWQALAADIADKTLTRSVDRWLSNRFAAPAINHCVHRERVVGGAATGKSGITPATTPNLIFENGHHITLLKVIVTQCCVKILCIHIAVAHFF